VDKGKEVGFEPVQPLTTKQKLENASVPGIVRPRDPNAPVLDAVTIYLTDTEAAHAQGTVDARTANPGNYQWGGSSCVDLGEGVVHATGAWAPHDLLPGSFVQDTRNHQDDTGSNQAP
jgi:hypothetical protein